MRRSYGYSVVEINQASGLPEMIVEMDVEPTREGAEDSATRQRELTAIHGRGETYVVVELIGVEDE